MGNFFIYDLKYKLNYLNILYKKDFLLKIKFYVNKYFDK